MKSINMIILSIFILLVNSTSFIPDKSGGIELSEAYYFINYYENRIIGFEILYFKKDGTYFYKSCHLSSELNTCDTNSGIWEIISDTEIILTSNDYLSLSDDMKNLAKTVYFNNTLLGYQNKMYYHSGNKLSFSKIPEDKYCWHSLNSPIIPRKVKKILRSIKLGPEF